MFAMKRPKTNEAFPVGTADRKTYLGGTDAAAVMNLSRWRTPIQVWGEKTGLIEPDQTESLPMKLGKRLEEVVAEMFTEKTGKKVRRANETLFHPRYGFLGANIDRRVVGEDTILECKTCSSWKAKEFQGEELPPEHIVQVVHYLAVTGAQRAYLAVLIGNQEFMIRTIERDDAMIAKLIEKEVAFWNEFVIPKIMPTIVSRFDDETLNALFPVANSGPAIALDDRANQLCETISAMKQDARSLDGQIDQLENELKTLLKDAECGATSRWLVTWKPQITKRVDTKALKELFPDVAAAVQKETSSRVLKIKQVEVL